MGSSARERGSAGSIRGLIALAAALLAAAVTLLSGTASADVVTLASGEEIRGRVLSETGGWVVIEVPGGQVRIARGQVLDIVREKPTTYWLEKGEEMLRLGAHDEAAAFFRKALEGGERRAALRLAAAESLGAGQARALGDLVLAERRLEEARLAAALDPSGGAEAALAAKRASAEIAALRTRALEAAGRGKKHCQERRLEEAISALRQAIALDRSLEQDVGPWLGRAAAEQGDVVAARGEYARAAVLFEEALKRAPSAAAQLARAVSTCQLGVAIERLRAGDPAAAIAALRAGLELDPDSRQARFFLALAHEVRGETLEAAAQYRGALAGVVVSVPDGDDLTPLRSAALAAAGKLPVDPNEFLSAARWDAAEEKGAVVASREGIEVRAPDAALGAQVLEAALSSRDEIAGWAGPEARSVPVAITIMPSKAAFRETTGQLEGVLGVTRSRLRSGDGSRQVISFAGAHDLLTSVIPHEMTHAVAFGQSRGVVPLWLNEGIAISSEPARDRGARAGRYRAALEAGSAIAIQEVMRLRGYPDESRIGAFYDASAALTGWLVERFGKGRVLDLARRAATSSMDAAFAGALDLPDADAAAAAFLASTVKETR